MATWQVSAPVWQWPSGNWFFLTVPDDVSDEIAEVTEGTAGGFGSVRVEARVGVTTWRTSVFPDSHRGSYVLPIKKAVRQAEDLDRLGPLGAAHRTREDWPVVARSLSSNPASGRVSELAGLELVHRAPFPDGLDRLVHADRPLEPALLDAIVALG